MTVLAKERTMRKYRIDAEHIRADAAADISRRSKKLEGVARTKSKKDPIFTGFYSFHFQADSTKAARKVQDMVWEANGGACAELVLVAS